MWVHISRFTSVLIICHLHAWSSPLFLRFILQLSHGFFFGIHTFNMKPSHKKHARKFLQKGVGHGYFTVVTGSSYRVYPAAITWFLFLHSHLHKKLSHNYEPCKTFFARWSGTRLLHGSYRVYPAAITWFLLPHSYFHVKPSHKSHGKFILQNGVGRGYFMVVLGSILQQ